MAKILVTGGAGFIGINLCKKLLKDGYKVTAIDNFLTSSKEHLKPLLKNPNFKFIKHDITKVFPDSLKINNRNLKIIYHLASPTGVPNLVPLAEEMLLTSSIGTKNVLELAKKVNAKIIFTSSSEVYGNPKIFPQDEKYEGNVNPNGIRSPYEEGKRFSESLIMTYVRKYYLEARIARVFNTYGPHMSQSDTRVIPKFINLASQNKPLTVEGKGSQTRTFCFIDDLVEGLILISEKGKKGEVYNIGNDQEIKIKNLAEKIIEITNSQSKISFINRPSHDHDRRLPSLKKINSLGWYPKTSLEDGLIKTLKKI